ncbi:hypothetical protein IWX90DRAFT_497458 [Phyllosticta citrichinensis]|uniref:Uncharacterized protein n=1 Tax=Phyllosticta citrichinensis TaxID=1130410 RepID=A0ABR1Y341_9PEZI
MALMAELPPISYRTYRSCGHVGSKLIVSRPRLLALDLACSKTKTENLRLQRSDPTTDKGRIARTLARKAVKHGLAFEVKSTYRLVGMSYGLGIDRTQRRQGGPYPADPNPKNKAPEATSRANGCVSGPRKQAPQRRLRQTPVTAAPLLPRSLHLGDLVQSADMIAPSPHAPASPTGANAGIIEFSHGSGLNDAGSRGLGSLPQGSCQTEVEERWRMFAARWRGARKVEVVGEGYEKSVISASMLVVLGQPEESHPSQDPSVCQEGIGCEIAKHWTLDNMTALLSAAVYKAKGTSLRQRSKG